MADENGLDPDSPFALLGPDEVAAWYAYMKVHLRMRYEMNHQLRSDSGVSLADFDVLVALTSETDSRMRISDLATRIGWERSRLSHHLRRMDQAGLVRLQRSESDRRSTEVALSDHGRQTLRDASPAHIDLVKRVFFAGLDSEDVATMAALMERIYDRLIDHGTLPRPADHP